MVFVFFFLSLLSLCISFRCNLFLYVFLFLAKQIEKNIFFEKKVEFGKTATRLS